MGTVLLSDNLPDGALIVRAETRGPGCSWDAVESDVPAGRQTTAPLALLGGYYSTWIQLYNSSTTVSNFTLGGTAFGPSTGACFTLPGQQLQVQPGELLTVQVPSDTIAVPAFARLTLTASPGSTLPAAAVFSLDRVTRGAVTSPFLSFAISGQTWVLPYFSVQGEQQATLLVPQTKGGTTTAETHFRLVGQSSLKVLKATLNSGSGPVTTDLSSLAPGSPVEGYILVRQYGLADGAPPALLTSLPTGNAAAALFRPAIGLPIPLGNLVSAPIQLSDGQSAKIGIYNGSMRSITALVRFRASGEGSSDIANIDFMAVAAPAVVIPAGGWSVIDLSDLIGRYGPYDSGFFEAIYSGLPGAVFAQVGALGPDAPATASLAPITFGTMLTFSKPYTIVGPSPLEVTAGTSVPVQALLWSPWGSAVAPPQGWALRAGQGSSQPAAAISGTGQAVTLTGSTTASAQALTLLPYLLPPGSEGDDVPDPGEGVVYAPGSMPKPTSASPHYGRKEGGDPLMIYGSGFDPASIQVKFRRTKSDGTTCGNWSKWIAGSGSTSNDFIGVIGPAPAPLPSAIYMSKTNKSCDNKNGNARLVVTNLATGNKGGLGWSNGAGFKYGWPAPTISSINPITGPISGGTTVTITGTNFAYGVKITIGTIPITITQMNNQQADGTYTSVTGQTGTGGNWFKSCGPAPLPVTGVPVNILATNPDGQSGQKTSAFTYSALPMAITGISPASGKSTGGTTVTISGTNLTRITAVYFGTVLAPCTSITKNASGFTVTAPAGCGSVPVKIQNTDNAPVTSNSLFTYTAVVPQNTGTTPPTWTHTCTNNTTVPIAFNFTKGPSPCDDITAVRVTILSAGGAPENVITCPAPTFSNTATTATIYCPLVLSNCPCTGHGDTYTYTLTLSADSAAGPVGPFTKSLTLTLDPACSGGTLAASITTVPSPASGTVPLTVYFTGAATGGTPNYTYRWSFGDGGTSTWQSDSHTYGTAKTYTAVLTVTDGSAHTATANVTVTAG